MNNSKTKYIFGFTIIIFSVAFFTALAWIAPRVEAGAQSIPLIEETAVSSWNNPASGQDFFNHENLTLSDISSDQQFLNEEFISAEIIPAHNFSLAGIAYQATVPINTDLKVKVRIKNNGKWSKWQNALNDENDQLDPGQFTDPREYGEIFYVSKGEAIQLQILLSSSAPVLRPSISNITIITRPLQNVVGLSQINSSGSRIIPRSTWIDNPLPQTQQETEWPNEYVGVEKFVIHHSGKLLEDIDGDRFLTQSDYLTLARGIYHWQAIAKRWGDVGYHYIVDPLGNIYEGKAGYDGVIGGHTVRSAACFKGGHLGYNKGSIGIAILGDYDMDTITGAAKDAVAYIVATKSREFELSPTANSFFIDRTMPTIVGHNEIDCTLCPGRFLTNSLADIRQRAQTQYNDLVAKSPIIKRATLINQSAKTLNLKMDQTQNVTVTFKNTGSISMHTYAGKEIYLADANIKQKLASIGSANLAVNDSQEISEEEVTVIARPDYYIASDLTPNIKPGENISFVIPITPSPILATEKRTYVLAQDQVGWFPNTEFSLTVNNVELSYGGLLKENTHPIAVLAEKEYDIKISYENTGGKDWLKEDTYLIITDLDINASRFAHRSWLTSQGEIYQDQEVVSPTEVTSFQFKMTSPTPGRYRQGFHLARKIRDDNGKIIGQEKIIGTEFDILTRVDSPWQGQVISHNVPAAMLSIWRPSITVEVMNTGSETWRGGSRTVMKVFDIVGTQSPFYDRYDWINKEVAAWQLERYVRPGETATFKLFLNPPELAGLYDLRLEFFNNGKRIYINNDKGYYLPTRVDTK